MSIETLDIIKEMYQMIWKCYKILKKDFRDINSICKFWQVIMTIFHIKPAYLNGSFSIENMIKITKLEGITLKYHDDDEWVISDILAEPSYYNAKVKQVYKTIKKDDPLFMYKAYGIMLDYPCAGDRRDIGPFMFVEFVLIPNKNYKKIFGNTKLAIKQDELILYSIGCKQLTKKNEKLFLKIGSMYNQFFTSLDIGSIIVQFASV